MHVWQPKQYIHSKQLCTSLIETGNSREIINISLLLRYNGCYFVSKYNANSPSVSLRFRCVLRLLQRLNIDDQKDEASGDTRRHSNTHLDVTKYNGDWRRDFIWRGRVQDSCQNLGVRSNPTATKITQCSENLRYTSSFILIIFWIRELTLYAFFMTQKKKKKKSKRFLQAISNSILDIFFMSMPLRASFFIFHELS